MAGTEAGDTVEFVLSILTGDATLSGLGLNGWFKDEAQRTNWPFGVVHFQAGNDIEVVGALRIGLDGLLTVKVVGRDGTFTSILRPAYRRVDALLQSASGGNADVLVFGRLHREQPLDYMENVGGEKIDHVGGIYRFQSQ